MYKEKYLKYKLKYLDLKGQIGGVITEDEKNKYLHDTNVIVPILIDFDDLSIFFYLQQNKNLRSLQFTNIRQIIENIKSDSHFKDTIYDLLEHTTVKSLILSGSYTDLPINIKDIKILARVLSYYENVETIDFTNNMINIAELYAFIRFLRIYDFNNKLHITFSNSDNFTKEGIDALKEEALEKKIEFIFI
jgi:hypothetical protein